MDVALIDGDIFVYKIAHRKKLEKIDKNLFTTDPVKIKANLKEVERSQEEIDKEMHECIKGIMKKTGAEAYIGFISGTRSQCFRTEVAVTQKYKGNRDNNKEIPMWFNYVENRFRNFYGFNYMNELEADDGMALVQSRGIEGCRTMIVSDDKDMLTVPGLHYINYKDKFVDQSTEEADFMMWTQVLTGDGTDNILGCAIKVEAQWGPTHKTKPNEKYMKRQGIGKVTAEKLLLKFKPTQWYAVVLSQYIKMFGRHDGILKFTENFRLIYLLRGNDSDWVTPEPLKVPQYPVVESKPEEECLI